LESYCSELVIVFVNRQQGNGSPRVRQAILTFNPHLQISVINYRYL